MDSTILLSTLLIGVIILSLTVHEYSHGRVALHLGDDTAHRLGRLTLNPLKHLDPLGALSFYFLGFGWAKPVPVDPRNLVHPRRDMMFVALAGPVSNVVLAVFCGFFLRILSADASPILFVLLSIGVYINVVLAIFNLLPIFPLDGGSVLKGLVSHETAARIGQFDRYGAVIILAVILLDNFAGTHILSFVLWKPIMYTTELLTQEMFPILKQVLMILPR